MGWEDAKDARLVLKGTLTLTPSLYCACAFPSDGVTELETFEAIHFDRDRLLLFVAVAAAEEEVLQQRTTSFDRFNRDDKSIGLGREAHFGRPPPLLSQLPQSSRRLLKEVEPCRLQP